nr:hypothetical protein [Tanacetum cinerariifolium]
MDHDSAHMMTASKVPMLKPGEYKIWRMRIEQYFQMLLCEVMENGATFSKTNVVEGVTTEVPITTAKKKAQRRLEVKARSTLMMGILNEHQLKFNSIKDAKKFLEAVEKRFGGNAATKKTQRNLLKQQYVNFTAPSSEMLDQTFDNMDLRWKMAMLTIRARRFLKKIGRKLTVNGNETIGFDKTNVKCHKCHKRGHVARECRALRNQDNKNKKSSRRGVPVETPTSIALVSCDEEKLSQKDVNQKLLRSLSPEWNTHVVVWRNKADLDTMSMDDLYNNLKVYEPEVKGMSSSSSSIQNMAFVSSSNNNTSSTNGAVNTALAVNTTHGVFTARTQVNAAYSTNIDNLSDSVICSFFTSKPNSPQLLHEDLEQIHPDDMKEMDLRWQISMLTMRARRFLEKIRRKLTVNGNVTIGFAKSNVECYNFHKRVHFARECRAPRNQDNKHKESSRRSMPVETSTSTALVSCDSLGGYD